VSQHDGRSKGMGRFRRSKRSVIGVLAALGVVLLVAVPVALAVDLFSDVPDENPFHDDISAIARAGITTGCAPGAYCPGDNVSRQAMAAFMLRGFGRVSQGVGDTTSVGGEAFLVATATLTPGLPSNALAGAGGFIKVDASVDVIGVDMTGCPCIYVLGLFDLDTDELLGDFVAGAAVGSAVPEMTIPLTGAYAVTGATPRTVGVVGFRETGAGTAGISSSVTASYFPFGSTGTNTLAQGTQIASPNPTRRARVEKLERLAPGIRR